MRSPLRLIESAIALRGGHPASSSRDYRNAVLWLRTVACTLTHLRARVVYDTAEYGTGQCRALDFGVSLAACSAEFRRAKYMLFRVRDYSCNMPVPHTLEKK